MTCEKCSRKWNVTDLGTRQTIFCPFCGCALDESEEKLDVLGALKKIIFEKSLQILDKPKIVTSLVADYVEGCQKEKKLLRIAASNGAFKYIVQIANEPDNTQRQLLIQKLNKSLIDDAFLSNDNAYIILKILLETIDIQEPYVNIPIVRQDVRDSHTANYENVWDEIKVGAKYHGVVKALFSYGAFVDIGGADGFIHNSELSWDRISNPADVVSIGDEIDVYVISFDKDKQRISLRYKTEEMKKSKTCADKNIWDKIKIGAKYHGVVKYLSTSGAFVDIGGADGFIHNSELSWERISNPAEVVSIGDEIDVYVISFDTEKRRISLGYKTEEMKK